MLITEQKPMDEILGYLEGEDKIFLVGCKGCAEGCETGGEAQVAEMRDQLEQAGKTITGTSLIDFVCNEQLTRLMLSAHADEIVDADSLIMMACGVAVQTASAIVDRLVHPGCNTVSLGGRHAEWREGERCLECGQCVLDYTGGICPIARCAKQLLNGPCGGSADGKCEVSRDLPCAWHEIVERLTAIGRRDRLAAVIPVKDWSRSLTAGPPQAKRYV